VTLSIPDFIDKNFIGRDPLKESIVACKPLETVRLLQMRDGIARHVHDRLDEIIYVIAGEGAVRIGEETTPIRAGALVVLPNGTAHAFERRGKNPLIVLSTLTGSPCEASKTAP
jgi:oxalate decarboxylase/phosphoglucose isomerase-like protein (cupin superfamily)